jgi:hypothetical protein
MQHYEKALDLIEAIETSAEKSNYDFTNAQIETICNIKSLAESKQLISNHNWEYLCRMYARINGHIKEQDLISEGFSSAKALSISLILSVAVVVVIAVLVWGVTR